MGKSLGDYVIEQSSSSDIKNIKWTQKNPADAERSKNKEKKTDKRFQNSSASNVIYTHNDKKIKPSIEKIFKIESIIDAERSKNKEKKTDKRFQHSSASNCKIKQGFKRPGR